MDILLNGEVVGSVDPIREGAAPYFTLKASCGKEVTLSSIDKTVVISTVPDLNTPTCGLQTKRFNEELLKNNDVEFITISTNTADDQKAHCMANDIKMSVLTDDGSFGKAYGLVFEDGALKGKLARAVYVIKKGQIIYSDIIMEIADEPYYNAALEAAKDL